MTKLIAMLLALVLHCLPLHYNILCLNTYAPSPNNPSFLRIVSSQRVGFGITADHGWPWTVKPRSVTCLPITERTEGGDSQLCEPVPFIHLSLWLLFVKDLHSLLFPGKGPHPIFRWPGNKKRLKMKGAGVNPLCKIWE